MLRLQLKVWGGLPVSVVRQAREVHKVGRITAQVHSDRLRQPGAHNASYALLGCTFTSQRSSNKNRDSNSNSKQSKWGPRSTSPFPGDKRLSNRDAPALSCAAAPKQAMTEQRERHPRSNASSSSSSSSSTSTSSKSSKSSRGRQLKDIQKKALSSLEDDEREDFDEDEGETRSLPLPTPPAGYVLNSDGEVELMAPPQKRLLTIVDPENGRSLECVIRRAFLNTQGIPFFLLYPLDTPLMMYRVAPKTGALSEISDEEMDSIFSNASYALAKKSLHLIYTGFSLTLRGAICFGEEDIINLDTEYGFSIGGSLSEGVDICTFTVGKKEYLIYTPFDPLMFIAYRDPVTNLIRIAEEPELLEDPKVREAIAEEEDYQRMVEEEDEMKELLREAKKK